MPPAHPGEADLQRSRARDSATPDRPGPAAAERARTPGVPEVHVRPDRQAVALYSPPWRLFDSGQARNAPVRVRGPEHERQIDTGAVAFALSPAHERELTARHESGHAVAYRALKVPIHGVELEQHRARGFTHRAVSEQPVPYWAVGHLAGLAAGELWLEQQGLATPGNTTLCDLQSADDHALLFNINTPCKLVFSYGARSEGRVPVRGDAQLLEIEIDTMIRAVRYLLHDAWDAVTMLSEHLLAHGTAGTNDLARLPAGRLCLDDIDEVLDAAMRGSAEEIPTVDGYLM